MCDDCFVSCKVSKIYWLSLTQQSQVYDSHTDLKLGRVNLYTEVSLNFWITFTLRTAVTMILTVTDGVGARGWPHDTRRGGASSGV